MADIIVDNTTDENDGNVTAGNRSLREAIGAAVAGDRILFDGTVFGADSDPLTNTEIDLTLGTLTIAQGIAIDGDTNGDGIADVTIDGAGNFSQRMFLVSTGTTGVAMESLTVIGADSVGVGGAIYAQANTELSITNSTFDDNESGQFGGAIRNQGDLTIANSTFTGNKARAGGAISQYFSAPLTIINSTFSENEANDGSIGGGAITSLGDAEIINSTFSGNHAFGFGGAIRVGAGTLTLSNSIVAGNDSGSGGGDVTGTITVSNGANIFGTDVAGDAAGDIEFGVGNAYTLTDVFETVGNVTVGGATFMAGIISANGSPTRMIDIDAAGLAFDGGKNADVPTEATLGVDVDGDGTVEATQVSVDQRGFQRIQGAAVDVGAVEKPFSLVVDTDMDENDGDFSANDLSLREAIGLIAPGGTITFDGSVFAADSDPLTNTEIDLTLGQLTIGKAVTINGDTNGDGVADVTIDGSGNSGARSFGVSNSVTDVAFESLTISGANSTGDGAALYLGPGAIASILNSTFTGNSATNFGAIYVNSSARLIIANSTFEGNTSERGGAIATYGTLNVLNSTFSGNHASGTNGGGAIYIGLGTTSLFNTTISGNHTPGNGGGILRVFGSLNVTNSIIAGNNAAANNEVSGISFSNGANIFGSNVTGNTGGDVEFGVGNAYTLSNVFETVGNVTVGGATFSAGIAADNGGPTRTIEIDAEGIAFDGGVFGDVPTEALLGLDVDRDGTLSGSEVDVDQRGADRAVGTVDIGALELVQTLTVDTTADEEDGDYSAGDLSLREALSLVASDGTVTFDPTVFGADDDERVNTTIALTQGTIEIGKDVTINGDTNADGVADVTLDGSGLGGVQMFAVASGSATFESLTFDGGQNSYGINVAPGATARVENSTFFNNYGTYGGAIANLGTTQVIGSTFADNTAYGGGAIYNNGALDVLNSTFYGNLATNAPSGGGAIYSVSALTVTNSTITGNYAIGDGGGVRGGPLTLNNSNVAGNDTASGDPEIQGVVTSNGSNIFGAGFTGSTTGNDLVLGSGTDLDDIFEKTGTVNIGAASFTAGLLSDHGGPVDTIGLLANEDNPALDAAGLISEATLGFDFNGDGDLLDDVDTDARGFDRTVDIQNVGNDVMTFADIGAFETQVVPTKGPDIVISGLGSDMLFGEGGNDLLGVAVSNPGDLDVLDGGADTDVASFRLFEDAVWVDLDYTQPSSIEAWTRDNATVTSGNWRGIAHLDNIENVTGSAFNDEFYGDAGNNRFEGLGGNDLFYIEAGLDTFEGGDDTDTANFSLYQNAVWVDLTYSQPSGIEAWTTGGPTINNVTWQAVAHIEEIENLVGTAFADEFYDDLNANNGYVTGDGDDKVFLAGGLDDADGGAGVDRVDFSEYATAIWVDLSYTGFTGFEAWTTGGSSIDFVNWQQIANLTGFEDITGSNFDDVFYGDAGDNDFSGGGGNDTFYVEAGFDEVDGGADFDLADFSLYQFAVWVDLAYAKPSGHEAWTRGGTTVTSGAWQAIAELENVEDVRGSAFNDEIYGDAGDNSLGGAGGNDLLRGLGGNDIFLHEGGLDDIDGGADTDVVDFSNFANAVWVDLDYESRGNTTGFEAWTRGGTTVTSGAWQAIAELSTVENLVGSAFDDRLLGDSTANTLTGDGGNDAFAFKSGFGTDTITDFQDTGSGFEDVLDFSEHSTVNNFTDITSITVVSGNTEVTTSDGTVILQGVTAGIAAEDFVF